MVPDNLPGDEMNNATATVVEHKLEPIAAAIDVRHVDFTPQAAINQFREFTIAVNNGGAAVCSAIVNTVLQARNATAKDFANATSAVVESTRFTVDNKRVDGDETALARKFQSMTRATFGAVLNGLLALEDVQSYRNSQQLYDDARKLLAECEIDWTGRTDAEKAKDKAHKANKKAVNEAAEEMGIDSGSILEMSVDDIKALRSKAAEKLAEKEAKAKLEAMEKRSKKLAKDLAESFGPDDAETVLKRALEMLGSGEWASA